MMATNIGCLSFRIRYETESINYELLSITMWNVSTHMVSTQKRWCLMMVMTTYQYRTIFQEMLYLKKAFKSEVLLWNVHQSQKHSGDIEEEQKRIEGPVYHVTIRWSISSLYKPLITLFAFKHLIKLVHFTHRKNDKVIITIFWFVS